MTTEQQKEYDEWLDAIRPFHEWIKDLDAFKGKFINEQNR